MNTKYLMIASSVVTGFAGLSASFFPDEFLKYIDEAGNEIVTVCVQITGALYLGFAIMNWMAKSVLIGGIYAKPLGMGNCLHFTIAALALFKFALNNHSSIFVWSVTIIYLAFAILFGIVVFKNPNQVTKTNN